MAKFNISYQGFRKAAALSKAARAQAGKKSSGKGKSGGKGNAWTAYVGGK